MIPLRDTLPSRGVPFVTWLMIAGSAFGFWLELAAGPGIDDMIHRYGLIPARYFTLRESTRASAFDVYVPFLSSAFLHGGWMHFLGNMLYLWIFGDNVEDRLGHARYLVFYLAGALAAGFAQAISAPGSTVPMVGASGAIAAVMGAYFVLFPRARIVSLVVWGFWVDVVAIPAVTYLAIWFGMQLLSGTFALASAAAGGVAWWAHAGGFAFGAAVGVVARAIGPGAQSS